MGHASACISLARTLLLRGHQVALMFGSLDPLEHFDAAGCEVFQAVHGMQGGLSAKPASYAEVLLGCGYDDAARLQPLAETWKGLFEQWRPDVVVADFAPTAHLAARALGIRRVSFGNGFLVPPRLRPMPSFRFNEAVPREALDNFDARATATINEVLRGWGRAPLDSLAQLLDADDEFLCTLPELDHYSNRPRSGYWGPRFNASSGVRAAWPVGARKRILAYVKPQHPGLGALLAAFAASGLAVVAFVPGLAPETHGSRAGAMHLLSTKPIRLEPLLPECDLVVSHGGEMAGGTLLHGIPQLVLPIQFEQYITARRVAQAGVGHMLAYQAGANDVARAMHEVLGNPRYAHAARTLARRYASFSPKEQRRRMAVRIEEIAALGPAAPILAPNPSEGRAA